VSVAELPSAGAEDVLIDSAGSLVTGLTNGDVVRMSFEGFAIVGNTGGRPLGIEQLADGNLLVCDHDRGLLRLDVTTGKVEVLLDQINGERLHFCSQRSRLRGRNNLFLDIIGHGHVERLPLGRDYPQNVWTFDTRASRRRKHGVAQGPRLCQRSGAGPRRIVCPRRRNDWL